MKYMRRSFVTAVVTVAAVASITSSALADGFRRSYAFFKPTTIANTLRYNPPKLSLPDYSPVKKLPVDPKELFGDAGVGKSDLYKKKKPVDPKDFLGDEGVGSEDLYKDAKKPVDPEEFLADDGPSPDVLFGGPAKKTVGKDFLADAGPSSNSCYGGPKKPDSDFLADAGPSPDSLYGSMISSLVSSDPYSFVRADSKEVFGDAGPSDNVLFGAPPTAKTTVDPQDFFGDEGVSDNKCFMSDSVQDLGMILEVTSPSEDSIEAVISKK